MCDSQRLLLAQILTCLFAISISTFVVAQGSAGRIENSKLSIEANQKGGTYTIRSKENARVWFRAGMAAQVNHRWLHAADYPKHEIKESQPSSNSTSASQLTITYSGLSGEPDLVCTVQLRGQEPFGEIEVVVRNNTAAPLTVQSIRAAEARSPFIALDGPESSERVLSDSFSEDRPNMVIHDLAQSTNGMHRAVGSQLIYNQQSKQSLFVGTLTSEKWLTVLRLSVDEKKPGITAYEVDSTGTTELTKDNSLRGSPKEDQIELSMPVEPGQSLASERIAVSLSSDYHAQLESYGQTIRKLHRARVSAPTPMGWWSWTAFYFALTEGTALTNAEFLAAHLKDYGYNIFHIDEGYQYARGDYTSPVANKYPHGIKKVEESVQALGLTPGIWTAPFEVSERSTVYTDHKDWLVHNGQGKPIPAGWVTEAPETPTNLDQLYILDSTNPGAQQYLRETYTTLARDWGIRYIKLDFMDDSAIEGNYYRPNTTALEAQRIGLQTIREAVGDDVLLDKDGSPMLNPVGIVDAGRISCDTGHTFEASRDAAPGIAARYYMNRNFFVGDPDAFSVSRQPSAGEQDHGGPKPLTLDEARVAIALAAVSGGMFEIGDDLPTLSLDADRMALLQNHDLIDMVRYGHAAKPLDLMSYAPEDEMPSVFLLRESPRQSILAVFNWTTKERQHNFSFSNLFPETTLSTHNSVSDVFSSDKTLGENRGSLTLDVAAHSVRMVKIIDTSIAASAPSVNAHVQEKIEIGKAAAFSGQANSNGVPALSFHWNFGDGTSADGASVTHSYTHVGSFTVQLRAEGLEGVPFQKSFTVSVAGKINTSFRPDLYQRYKEER